jgi:hypothetical protein
MGADNLVIDNDLKKIHNEINTLGNIRIVIAVGAVSAIGFAVSAGLKFSPPQNWIGMIYITVVVNWVWGVVLILCIASLAAWKRVRLYAAYMRFNEYSQWEEHWHAFRFGNIENKDFNQLRNKLRHIDVVGFGGIFIMAMALIFMQIIYMGLTIWVSSGEPFNMPLWYSAAPILCSLCLLFVFYRKLRDAHKDEYGLEEKITYIWCTVLRRRGHLKRCGNHVCCECCAEPSLIHDIDSHSGR